MQLTDQIAFKQMLIGISLLYGKPLHEAVFTLWWEALKSYPWSEVKAALQAHVVNPDTGKFMPKPADVIAYWEGSTESQALQAWTQVVNGMRRVGAYDSVRFADPLIHAVMRDMGGWVALCHSKASELPFLAKEFEKRYRALALHPPPDCPPQLTGLVAQQNQLDGYSPPNPVCIDPPLTWRKPDEKKLR